MRHEATPRASRRARTIQLSVVMGAALGAASLIVASAAHAAPAARPLHHRRFASAVPLWLRQTYGSPVPGRIMRIIAGEWRRRQLRAPPGESTRPTADRTRETLFAMLASRLGSFEGLAVADLFAGSGALGLEALSRGAATCLFAENEPAAIRALRANIAALCPPRP